MYKSTLLNVVVLGAAMLMSEITEAANAAHGGAMGPVLGEPCPLL